MSPISPFIQIIENIKNNPNNKQYHIIDNTHDILSIDNLIAALKWLGFVNSNSYWIWEFNTKNLHRIFYMCQSIKEYNYFDNVSIFNAIKSIGNIFNDPNYKIMEQLVQDQSIDSLKFKITQNQFKKEIEKLCVQYIQDEEMFLKIPEVYLQKTPIKNDFYSNKNYSNELYANKPNDTSLQINISNTSNLSSPSSTSTTSSPSNISELKKCDKCNLNKIELKKLQCEHTLCETCITFNENRKQFFCIICKKFLFEFGSNISPLSQFKSHNSSFNNSPFNNSSLNNSSLNNSPLNNSSQSYRKPFFSSSYNSENSSYNKSQYSLQLNSSSNYSNNNFNYSQSNANTISRQSGQNLNTSIYNDNSAPKEIRIHLPFVQKKDYEFLNTIKKNIEIDFNVILEIPNNDFEKVFIKGTQPNLVEVAIDVLKDKVLDRYAYYEITIEEISSIYFDDIETSYMIGQIKNITNVEISFSLNDNKIKIKGSTEEQVKNAAQFIRSTWEVYRLSNVQDTLVKKIVPTFHE